MHPAESPGPRSGPTDIRAALPTSGDDDADDLAGCRRPHLSLIVTVEDGVMTATRRDSMARHPSVARQD
ncbi:MAG TPA: hypothetical protein VHS52_06870 [Acidimicrobiales bacterium]|nr:hypothetical protein [Acidimicrobiales bacterium]